MSFQACFSAGSGLCQGRHSVTCVDFALVGAILKPELLPGVAIPLQLGCQRVHDVLLALDALLPSLNLLDPFVRVTQLVVPLPELLAVLAYLRLCLALHVLGNVCDCMPPVLQVTDSWLSNEFREPWAWPCRLHRLRTAGLALMGTCSLRGIPAASEQMKELLEGEHGHNCKQAVLANRQTHLLACFDKVAEVFARPVLEASVQQPLLLLLLLFTERLWVVWAGLQVCLPVFTRLSAENHSRQCGGAVEGIQAISSLENSFCRCSQCLCMNYSSDGSHRNISLRETGWMTCSRAKSTFALSAISFLRS